MNIDRFKQWFKMAFFAKPSDKLGLGIYVAANPAISILLVLILYQIIKPLLFKFYPTIYEQLKVPLIQLSDKTTLYGFFALIFVILFGIFAGMLVFGPNTLDKRKKDSMKMWSGGWFKRWCDKKSTTERHQTIRDFFVDTTRTVLTLIIIIFILFLLLFFGGVLIPLSFKLLMIIYIIVSTLFCLGNFTYHYISIF